jgi:hypothetical protein
MTIPEILDQLKLYTGKFPMAAIRAAIEQREAITAELLREFEEIAAHGEEYAGRENYMLHVFAVFLLAQFREKRAFQPLVKLVSLPGELPFDLFGDTITERLSGLLGTLYDGDRAALERLAQSEEVNKFVRSAALDSFIVLERAGQISREDVIGYFRELFQGGLKREHSYAWDGLICSCADLPAPELLQEVRQAYADGLVNPGVADLPGIERDLLAGTEVIKSRGRGRYSLVTDVIAEMEWWAAFRAEPRYTASGIKKMKTPPLPELSWESSGSPSTGFRRAPKIGRNDPCPCGSGKKYKRCCHAKK